MKSIINGRRYDTEAPNTVCVASWSNGSPRDFSHISEDLYRTGHGNWFVYGEGGPMSRYAESCGQNQWSGGEKITPMTAKGALVWLEEHDCAEAIEKWFADSVVDA